MAEGDDEHDDSVDRRREPLPLAEAVGHIVRRLVWRGRQELGRAATEGRSRLELRQLQRDRDQFWIRLGKTAYHLVEGGEIDHVALRKAMTRIDEIEAQIGALREHHPDVAADAEAEAGSDEGDASAPGADDE